MDTALVVILGVVIAAAIAFLAWRSTIKGGAPPPREPDARRDSSGHTDDDADGLSDAREVVLGTDPNNTDTDRDGLSDGYEAWRSDTDPLSGGDDDELDELLLPASSPEPKLPHEGASATSRIVIGSDSLRLDDGNAGQSKVSLDAAVKAALGVEVRLGALGLVVPQLRQGREDAVMVVISRADDANSLIATFIAKSQVPHVEPIKTSAVMRVDLTGSSFQVRRLNPPDGEQVVSDTATWEFEVLPLSSGVQFLTVSASMRIPVPGYGERTVGVPSLRQEFRVDVDRLYAGRAFMRRHWQWVGTSVIAAAAVVAGVIWR